MTKPVLPTGGGPEFDQGAESAIDPWIPPYSWIHVEGHSINLDAFFGHRYLNELLQYGRVHVPPNFTINDIDRLTQLSEQHFEDRLQTDNAAIERKNGQTRIDRQFYDQYDDVYTRMRQDYMNNEVVKLQVESASEAGEGDIIARDLAEVLNKFERPNSFNDYRVENATIQIVDHNWGWRMGVHLIDHKLLTGLDDARVVAELRRQFAYYHPNFRQAFDMYRQDPMWREEHRLRMNDYFLFGKRLFPERAEEFEQEKREYIDALAANIVNPCVQLDQEIKEGQSSADLRNRADVAEKIQQAGGFRDVVDELMYIDSFVLSRLRLSFANAGPVIYPEAQGFADRRDLAAAIGLMVKNLDTQFMNGDVESVLQSTITARQWLRKALSFFVGDQRYELDRVDFMTAENVRAFLKKYRRHILDDTPTEQRYNWQDEWVRQEPTRRRLVDAVEEDMRNRRRSTPSESPRSIRGGNPDVRPDKGRIGQRPSKKRPPAPPLSELVLENGRTVRVTGLSGHTPLSEAARRELPGDTELTALVTELVTALIPSSGILEFVAQFPQGRNERFRSYVFSLPEGSDPNTKLTDQITEQYRGHLDNAGNFVPGVVKALESRLGQYLPNKLLYGVFVNIQRLIENGATRPVIVVTFSL